MRWRLAILAIVAWLLIGPPAAAAVRHPGMFSRTVLSSTQLPTEVAPQNATDVVSVAVDNYSGFWLFLTQEGFFIPPYTIGWIANVHPGTTNVPIQKKTPVTMAGSNTDAQIIVSLYDSLLQPSSGYQIINTSPVHLWIANFQDLVPAGPGSTFIDLSGFGGAAGNVFYLLAVSATFDDNGVNPPPAPTQTIFLHFQYSSVNEIDGVINANAPVMHIPLNREVANFGGHPGRVNVNWNASAGANFILGIEFEAI